MRTKYRKKRDFRRQERVGGALVLQILSEMGSSSGHSSIHSGWEKRKKEVNMLLST